MGKYAIGIDLGGTNTRVALITSGTKIIVRRQFATKTHRTKKRLIDGIVSSVHDIIAERRLRPSQIAGIGIGAPGLVDSEKGVVHNLTNIPGWKNVNLKRLLQRKTGIRVSVDNDVNLMALAESRLGAARGSKDVFCITLGTGIGGGIVIGGELYRGNTRSAGEIGHVVINPKGPRCGCGNRGCLEAYVGNSYLVRRARRALGVKNITPELITKAARNGSASAKKIWKETAGYLAVGLVTAVNLLDPEVIVIGGGVAGAGRFLFGPLIEAVRKEAMPVPARAVKIVRAKLGNDAGMIGAAILAREGK